MCRGGMHEQAAGDLFLEGVFMSELPAQFGF